MKYEDKNGNGRKNKKDGGLSGWTIVLKKNNAVVATTTTAADGTYSFTALTPGLYKVLEVMQAGWRQTDKPSPIQIRSGTAATHEDFGNTKKIERRWYDRHDDDRNDD
jgi:protocatechuate 3,4-dioxygenase beta subunit